jgi:hypothetical protein
MPKQAVKPTPKIGEPTLRNPVHSAKASRKASLQSNLPRLVSSSHPSRKRVGGRLVPSEKKRGKTTTPSALASLTVVNSIGFYILLLIIVSFTEDKDKNGRNRKLLTVQDGEGLTVFFYYQWIIVNGKSVPMLFLHEDTKRPGVKAIGPAKLFKEIVRVYCLVDVSESYAKELMVETGFRADAEGIAIYLGYKFNRVVGPTGGVSMTPLDRSRARIRDGICAFLTDSLSAEVPTKALEVYELINSKVARKEEPVLAGIVLQEVDVLSLDNSLVAPAKSLEVYALINSKVALKDEPVLAGIVLQDVDVLPKSGVNCWTALIELKKKQVY